jgi:hypothetical protein
LLHLVGLDFITEKERLHQVSLTYYSTEVPTRNDDFGGCKGYKEIQSAREGKILLNQSWMDAGEEHANVECLSAWY